MYFWEVPGDCEAAGLETRLREARLDQSARSLVFWVWDGRVILTTPTGQSRAGDWLACLLHTVPLALRIIPTTGEPPTALSEECLGAVLPPLGVSFSLQIGG